MARVEHYGPFIGSNLGPRAAHSWLLGPFPKLFDATADASAHPWPHTEKEVPGSPLRDAELEVTTLHSRLTAAGERFLVLTVQNNGQFQVPGYNVRVTLTSAGGRAGGGS